MEGLMDWVKIMCNLLDHRKIKMIRKGPEGNTLVLLWLLMLTEAGKCNRGGYLMVSDSLPYAAETLSMVTDIPLPTVQLGLATFAGMDMIDRQDGAIFIKNWGKYQSEDKLEARREKERQRQQRHRQNEREKLRALLAPDRVSRDSHVALSRDVTLENRQEKNRGETTEEVRLLLLGTPLSKIAHQTLQVLVKRHGFERLLQAADIAAETWRRSREEMHNPGGYLQSLCASLIVPDWYVPFLERMALVEASRRHKSRVEAEQAELKVQEEAQIAARNALWKSLSEEQREEYRFRALADLPTGITPSIAVTAMAKLLAWEAEHLTGSTV
jgi:predicted phage replisome organizer